MTKGQLRNRLLRRLKQQKEEEKRRGSEAIRRKVFRLTAFRRARTVCCYVALPYEVQTLRMIEAMLSKGKRVAVPVSEPKTKRLVLSEIRNPDAELMPGAFGVREPAIDARRPIRVSDVDLVLVPGLAFDRGGFRLGHGYGYYDRFLSRLPKGIPTIGLAFGFQMFDRLPVSAHDHAVQAVVTA